MPEEGSREITTGASAVNTGKDAVAIDIDCVGRGKQENEHIEAGSKRTENDKGGHGVTCHGLM